jgi:hypothetical protein
MHVSLKHSVHRGASAFRRLSPPSLVTISLGPDTVASESLSEYSKYRRNLVDMDARKRKISATCVLLKKERGENSTRINFPEAKKKVFDLQKLKISTGPLVAEHSQRFNLGFFLDAL